MQGNHLSLSDCNLTKITHTAAIPFTASILPARIPASPDRLPDWPACMHHKDTDRYIALL